MLCRLLKATPTTTRLSCGLLNLCRRDSYVSTLREPRTGGWGCEWSCWAVNLKVIALLEMNALYYFHKYILCLVCCWRLLCLHRQHIGLSLPWLLLVLVLGLFSSSLQHLNVPKAQLLFFFPFLCWITVIFSTWFSIPLSILMIILLRIIELLGENRDRNLNFMLPWYNPGGDVFRECRGSFALNIVITSLYPSKDLKVTPQTMVGKDHWTGQCSVVLLLGAKGDFFVLY